MSKGNDKSNVFDLNKEKDKKTITVADESTQFLPFTAIPNEILEHPDINATGKLLMVYLLKHAGIPEWVFYDEAMKKFLECGRNALEAAFKTLRIAGYVTNVILYDSKGKVCGSKRIFSRNPKFLELNKSKLKIVPKAISCEDFVEAPISGASKSRGPLERGILKRKTLKNKNTNKQQTTKGTDIPDSPVKPKMEKTLTANTPREEPNGSVVVEHKIDDLIKMVHGWAVSRVMLESWVKKHGTEYVLQKIELTQSATPRNPGAYLNKALSFDWLPPAPKEDEKRPNSPVETIYPTHGENVAWYNKLAENEKLAVLSQAVYKQRYFERHLKNANVSVLDADFTENCFFKMMMELVGRAL